MRQGEDDGPRYACPACGERLFGWNGARHPLDGSVVVLDRCEDCGLVVTRTPTPPDPTAELAPLEGEAVLVANRRSFAAGIGGAQWAGLRPDEQRLHPTPRAAELLYRKAGVEIELRGTPFSGATYRGMLQTLVNSFTLRDNFITNVRRGRINPTGIRARLLYGLDALVSVLVAVPMTIVALALELVGSALGRGGLMELGRARRD